MEYKIIKEEMSKLFSIAGSFNIELVNKTGWINSSCAETFYSIPKKKDIKGVVEKYIQEKMNLWQERGEFESRENYTNRILYERDKKKNEVTLQATDMFEQDYAGFIDWNKATISRYDPDKYSFQINISGLDTIIINVPIDKARELKEKWDNVVLKNLAVVESSQSGFVAKALIVHEAEMVNGPV